MKEYKFKNYQFLAFFIFILSLTTIGYLLLDTLAPFIIAFIAAYLLQPLAQWLERKTGLSRAWISILIIGLFLLFITIISLLILPFLYEQLSLVIQKLPIYKDKITKQIIPKMTEKLSEIDPVAASKIKFHIQNVTEKILGETFNILNNLWQYTLSTIHFVATLILVPFILYYFIKDWNQGTREIEELIPLNYKEHYKNITISINHLLAAYIRGQLNICMILTLYYSTIFTFLKLDFAFLLGILTGFLIIIPFIGLAFSLILTLLIAYFAGSTLSLHIYIILAYFIGHAIESYILVPRLIGKNIGLHPVWVVFAVLALGNLYGIVGIIAAIPTAGIVKILLKFVVNSYKNSKLYQIPN